jgi:hypothetical protein
MLTDLGPSMDCRTNRKWLLVPLFVGLAVISPTTSGAAGRENARQIVENAIRAAGGYRTLARYGARTWKEQAVYHGAGGDESYEASYSEEWPDKFRVDTGDYTMVVNGDRGWIRTDGETREMTPAELEEHREGIYSVWVFSLVPLVSEEFTLSRLAAERAGRPTAGINVAHRGHGDIQMYFDSRTGLLASSHTRYKEARSGQEVEQETSFSDYKDEAGIQTPTRIRIKRNGTLVVESKVETTYVERLDERIFARP